jgi:hypothetical protein
VSISAEQRRLAAIMFTDMVGYSALSQRDDKFAQELPAAPTISDRRFFADAEGDQ